MHMNLTQIQRVKRRRRKPMTMQQKFTRAEQARRQQCPSCGRLRRSLRGNVGEYAPCEYC